MIPRLLSRRALVPALLFVSAFSAIAHAVPRTIPVQGQLTSPSGAPVNGTRSVTFRLYRTPTDATALWSETEDVPVQNGRFAAILGDGSAFSSTLSFAEPYFLGITVGSDPEMAPRMPLAAVPYALALPNVMVDPFGNVGIGTISPVSRLTVQGGIESRNTGFKFPDGTVQTSAATAGQFARAPFLTGYESGLYAESVPVDIRINGQVTKPAAKLAAPFTSRFERIEHRISNPDGTFSYRYIPGKYSHDSLVLRRPVSPNREWSQWYASSFQTTPTRLDVEIRFLQQGVVKSTWAGQQGWVSRYRLRLADDGLPVEEIAIEFDQGKQLRRLPSAPFKGRLPETDARTGFTSEQPVGTTYGVSLDGIALDAAVIASDAGPSTGVVEVKVLEETGEVYTRRPGQPDPGTVTVRQNPAAGTKLNEWFDAMVQGRPEATRRLSVDLSPDSFGLVRLENAWPCSFTLRLADDGVPVEDIEFAGDMP